MDGDSHIEKEGTTYLRHLQRSMRFALLLLVGSINAAIHALIPQLKQKETSDLIARLYSELHPAARPKPVSKGLRAQKRI